MGPRTLGRWQNPGPATPRCGPIGVVRVPERSAMSICSKITANVPKTASATPLVRRCSSSSADDTGVPMSRGFRSEAPVESLTRQ